MNPSRFLAASLAAVFFLLSSPENPAWCQDQDETPVGQNTQSVRDILDSPYSRPRADTFYLLALAAARKGDVALAFRYIQSGLQADSKHTKILNLRAAIYARQGKTPEAVEEFRRVLRIAPDDTFAKESLRAIMITYHPPTPEITPLKPPKIVNPPNTLASGSSKASNDSNASETAAPKRVLEATYFDQIKVKQRCFYSMGTLKRAQEALIKATKDKDAKAKPPDFAPVVLVDRKLLNSVPICPENASYTWKSDAPSCSKHGDYAALEAEVTTVFLDFNRGMQAKIGRNFPEALRAFQQVVVLYPQWGEAHYQLGDTLFRIGEDAQAIEQVKSALKIDGENHDAQMLLANLYFKTGKKENALSILDEVATKSSGSVYGLAARSVAKAIRSGKNYYQLFPPY